MPIYEYACSQCQHHLEKLQKLADDPLRECPQCGQNSLKRLMSAAGFKLKGTGWYETDFKHKDKPTDNTSSEQADTKQQDSQKAELSSSSSESSTSTNNKTDNSQQSTGTA